MKDLAHQYCEWEAEYFRAEESQAAIFLRDIEEHHTYAVVWSEETTVNISLVVVFDDKFHNPMNQNLTFTQITDPTSSLTYWPPIATHRSHVLS